MRIVTVVAACCLMLTGCTSFNHISDNDDVWVTEYERFLGRSTLYHCRANKGEKRPTPICIPAAYLDNPVNRLNQN